MKQSNNQAAQAQQPPAPIQSKLVKKDFQKNSALQVRELRMNYLKVLRSLQFKSTETDGHYDRDGDFNADDEDEKSSYEQELINNNVLSASVQQLLTVSNSLLELIEQMKEYIIVNSPPEEESEADPNEQLRVILHDIQQEIPPELKSHQY